MSQLQQLRKDLQSAARELRRLAKIIGDISGKLDIEPVKAPRKKPLFKGKSGSTSSSSKRTKARKKRAAW